MPSADNSQFREHSSHPPRVRRQGSLFVVEAYSPGRGYLPMAEWLTQGEADEDLGVWEAAWRDELARMEAELVGARPRRTYRNEEEMQAEMRRLLAEEAALFYAPPAGPAKNH